MDDPAHTGGSKSTCHASHGSGSVCFKFKAVHKVRVPSRVIVQNVVMEMGPDVEVVLLQQFMQQPRKVQAWLGLAWDRGG